ncbi:DoxX family protein [Muricauda sp. CAU 1633]|uniref:DoxX family protein n=1 Tax=Allomuricauda sp. CAU 1633 TaxID=2816036 RepID=UPI001A908326|nr:DoxX family protein [Muricauda sp. CAU 1633]MBO0323001.1 DoxX family protein [Muricauda sp. CAU 1633]
MVQRILATNMDITPTILRIVLGCVIFADGAQKLFGVWGGHGPSWTVAAWQQWWNVPSFLTYTVICIESFGAVLLVLGLFTRIWAFSIGLIMLVAVYLVHLRWGFYMNWYMQPQIGEGFEYHLLVLAMVIVLILTGGGRWSLDRFFIKRNQTT